MSPKMRRMGRKVAYYICVPAAVAIVFVVRALRPFILIRFGPLVGSRIGHYAANTEIYLCERDAGIHGPRTIDLFYNGGGAVCNAQLKKMWKRTRGLRILQLVSVLDRVSRSLPGYDPHIVQLNSDRDIRGLMSKFPPHLTFTEEEERQGRLALQSMGVAQGTPFVCFHARDSAYLGSVYPDTDWRYHDYRNSTIHNYVSAVEELTRRGYLAVRMGYCVKDSLSTENSMIIDYATKGRNDFLDIYLAAKCHFFICDTAGIQAVAVIFRRPMAFVNLIPLEHVPASGPDDLFIPKKLWLRGEHRFMNFQEILKSGVGRFLATEQYEQMGIDVLENTPEEITALAAEMDERLKGTWRTTEEDEQLQRRFWSLFKRGDLNGVFLSRIGAEFLRQNRDLLS